MFSVKPGHVQWGGTPDQVSKPPATADWIQPPKFNPQKWSQVSSMNGLFCVTARNNTLNNASLYSYGIRFLSVDLTWDSPGFFWGEGFEICQSMLCVCAQTFPH